MSFCLLSVGFLYPVHLPGPEGAGLSKHRQYAGCRSVSDPAGVRHLRSTTRCTTWPTEDVPATVLGRVTLFLIQVFMVALPSFGYEFRISKKVMLLSLLLQGAILLSVAGDVPEDLLHGGEALPGAADRRERGCGRPPAEGFVFQPQ